MKIGIFAKQFRYSMIALAFFSLFSPRSGANEPRADAAAQQQDLTPNRQNKASALIKIVRKSSSMSRRPTEAGN